jgi:hypothetical protein
MKLTPILPKKKLPSSREIERVIEQVMDNAAYDAMDAFLGVTSTWKNRPSFHIRKTNSGRTVSTRSKIFAYVDRGTRAHTIKPKRAGGVLRFKAGGFKPKSRPGSLKASRGAPGRKWVASKGVQHPGTEAREFSKKVGEKMQKEIGKEMRKAFKALLK